MYFIQDGGENNVSSERNLYFSSRRDFDEPRAFKKPIVVLYYAAVVCVLAITRKYKNRTPLRERSRYTKRIYIQIVRDENPSSVYREFHREYLIIF